MTDKQLLINAKKLIQDPNKWTQKAYGRDKDGYSITQDISKAAKWCALGACYAAAHSLEEDFFDWVVCNPEAIDLLKITCREVLSPWEIDESQLSVIMLVNDCLGHKYIMQAFDRAIELAGD